MILDMTNILNNIQFGKLYTFVLSDIIQIIIIFLAMYYIIKEIKDTRAWIITKGIAIVLCSSNINAINNNTIYNRTIISVYSYCCYYNVSTRITEAT